MSFCSQGLLEFVKGKSEFVKGKSELKTWIHVPRAGIQNSWEYWSRSELQNAEGDKFLVI